MRIGVLAKVAKRLIGQTGSDPRACYIGTGDIVEVLNPADETAIEEALRIKEEDPDTEVAAVSIGGQAAEIQLRRLLAMGADRALHIQFDGYDELDAWATASVLARALRGERFDLILCGEEAIDGNVGLVGPYLAEILEIPHISGVVRLVERSAQDEIVAHRGVDRNERVVLACSLPALLAVRDGINVPRYPSARSVLQARTRTIERRTLADLEMPADATSLNRTETIALTLPKPTRRDRQNVAPGLSAAERMNLMMKGGTQQAHEGSALIEGISDEALGEVVRVLRECGVIFKTSD